MRIRKILIAVFMTALCLLGTMPLSASAYKTLFVLGDTYQYNDVIDVVSPLLTSFDDIPPSVNISGSILPFDAVIIDNLGNNIGSADFVSGNINSISTLNFKVTEEEYTSSIKAIAINGVGDFIIYSSDHGYTIPTYIRNADYSVSYSFQESITSIESGHISFYSCTLMISNIDHYLECYIDTPDITLTIDSIEDNTSYNMSIITGFISAFTPVNPFYTQLSYTTDGYTSLFSNTFSIIQDYAVINNPLIQIALFIMALAICLLFLKFLFDWR